MAPLPPMVAVLMRMPLRMQTEVLQTLMTPMVAPQARPLAMAGVAGEAPSEARVAVTSRTRRRTKKSQMVTTVQASAAAHDAAVAGAAMLASETLKWRLSQIWTRKRLNHVRQPKHASKLSGGAHHTVLVQRLSSSCVACHGAPHTRLPTTSLMAATSLQAASCCLRTDCTFCAATAHTPLETPLLTHETCV